jgi:hypothetical protein
VQQQQLEQANLRLLEVMAEAVGGGGGTGEGARRGRVLAISLSRGSQSLLAILSAVTCLFSLYVLFRAVPTVCFLC